MRPPTTHLRHWKLIEMLLRSLHRTASADRAAIIGDTGRSTSGQSLVETALILPLLLMLLFNAVNFGYFFLMAVNLAAAPRSGVAYSIQGNASPSATSLPAAGPSSTTTTVSYLTYQDMTGAIYSPSGTPVQVCSAILGVNNAGNSTQTAKCASYGSTYTFPTPASDPESPNFVLNQVDVAYTFTPLINGTMFNIFTLAAPTCSSSSGSVSCTFHRQVVMRAMN
jgi:Flp pilus assembly protein TadG